MSNTPESTVDLAAIYREALAREPWEEADTPDAEQVARVGQFDEVAGWANAALGEALDAEDLATARRVLRALQAAHEAFGSASWAI